MVYKVILYANNKLNINSKKNIVICNHCYNTCIDRNCESHYETVTVI